MEPTTLAWTSSRSSMSIGTLTASDFDKSMLSHNNAEIWQDVYKPVVAGQDMYVKFTLDTRGELLLISFKGNES